MGWAWKYIEKLKCGETVQFRPTGNSMKGKINPGQLVTVEPIKDFKEIKTKDIVLCTVGGGDLLHLVDSVKLGGCLIRNNFGKMNGFASWNNIHGKVIKVE